METVVRLYGMVWDTSRTGAAACVKHFETLLRVRCGPTSTNITIHDPEHLSVTLAAGLGSELEERSRRYTSDFYK